MKYLITNADDLGWGFDITSGIIDSYNKGVLTSASVIISEIDPKSLELIKVTKSLGLGLHLNIATGSPISQSWREKYGNFSHPLRPHDGASYIQKTWDDHYGLFDTEVVFLEFEAQLELFKSKLNIFPDHIDTHYNTYSVENVFDAYLKLASKYNLPVRQPIKYKGDAEMASGTETSEIVCHEGFLKKLKDKGVKTTTYFSPEYINLHKDYTAAILSEMDKIADHESIEISFHPGYREDWRKKQVQILTDPDLKKALEGANVKLINYHELATS